MKFILILASALTVALAKPSVKSQVPCNVFCPRIYWPVCGSNGVVEKTFSNKCLLDADACENNQNFVMAYEGKCKKDCETMCTMNYDPVCAAYEGYELKTFSNVCELNVENCKTNGAYFLMYAGECQKTF